MATHPLMPYAKVMPNERPGITTLWTRARPGREWQPPDLDPFHDPEQGRDPATSFPDPFYRREATRLALQRGEGPYHRLWGIALKALAAGLLQVEMVDLAQERGALGRALLRLHPQRRFMAHFSATLRGQRLLMALGDPELLLWPAARRTPEQWSDLERAADAAEGHPKAALADLAAILSGVGAWQPEAVLWQAGVARALDGMGPGPGLSTYHRHTRAVGPLPLRLRWDGHDRVLPVYWPVVEPGFGARVLRLASARLEPSGEGVEASWGPHPARLRLTLPGGTDEAAVYKGRGVVGPPGPEAPPRVEALTLDEPGGLFEGLGRGLYPDHGLDPAELLRWPLLYPDPLRVLVHALGPAGLPARSLKGSAPAAAYGRMAVLAALDGGAPLPGADEVAREGGGFVWARPPAPAQVFVEPAGAPGELCALGWVLWEVFLGSITPGVDGELRAGSATHLRLRRDGRPEPLALPPFDEALRQDSARRLATLQRFARAWSLGDRPATRGGTLAELLTAAARAWVRWVTGAPPFPNGPAATASVRWAPPGQGELDLPLDPVAGVSA